MLYRLKDILWLCQHGLKDGLFLGLDTSKCGVEVRNGVPGFVQPSYPDSFDPIEQFPELINQWTKEYDAEDESYLYILQPFYHEVLEFYYGDKNPPII